MKEEDILTRRSHCVVTVHVYFCRAGGGGGPSDAMGVCTVGFTTAGCSLVSWNAGAQVVAGAECFRAEVCVCVCFYYVIMMMWQ